MRPSFARLSFATLVVATLVAFSVAPAASAHQGHTHSAPWEVCEAQTLGDPCQWEDAEQSLYIGTCRGVSDALICVRNQPIQKPETASSWWTLAKIFLLAATAFVFIRRPK